MRIFFVGMHNKPGMQPLDTSTRSGLRIDSLIYLLNGNSINCIKTNLCEMDYLPGPNVVKYWANKWREKHNPTKDDVIVLLGNWVQKNFIYLPGDNVVKIQHPATRKKDYTATAYQRIKEAVMYRSK